MQSSRVLRILILFVNRRIDLSAGSIEQAIYRESFRNSDMVNATPLQDILQS